MESVIDVYFFFAPGIGGVIKDVGIWYSEPLEQCIVHPASSYQWAASKWAECFTVAGEYVTFYISGGFKI